MAETLFELEHSISQMYSSLSPLSIDREPFVEVIELFADLTKLTKHEKKMSDPNRVIRRPAGDDWF
jgi:hypothetical protein